MSFRVVSKVLRDSDEKLARRLILIVLGEAAHDDGVAWLNQETISAKSRIALSHVNRCLGEMSDEGVLEIRKAKRGRVRINVYRIVLPGLDEVDYDRLPFDLDRPFTTSEIQMSSESDGVRSTQITVSDPRKNQVVSPIVEPLGEPSIQIPAKVDRKPVSIQEGTLARLVLQEWNRQTGQNLRSRDWMSKLIMRIREYPDLGVDEHAHVIAATLQRPWWSGPATPSVVYGSGAQFERCLVAIDGAPVIEKEAPLRFGRGLTTAEMLKRTEGQK